MSIDQVLKAHPLSCTDVFAQPENLIDAVIEAKILTGESFDGESEDAVRDRVYDEIHSAQCTMTREVAVDGDRVTVYRAMGFDPGVIDALEAGAPLGSCWSWSEAGAFPYNASRRKETYVFAATVDVQDIDWLTSIALESSGEAELRLAPDAELTLLSIKRTGERGVRSGEFIRQDLIGTVFPAEDCAWRNAPSP